MVWLALLLTVLLGSYILCLRAAKRGQLGWTLVFGCLPGLTLLTCGYYLLAAVTQ